MSDVSKAFGGSVPEFYQRYMVPMLFEPHARILAARLAYLRARALVDVLPPAVGVIATDLNETMLAQARLQPGAGHVLWQQADAMSLPFPDRHFDAVVCQFGAMFFPDKRVAFREALRVLVPGGRFVFSVWDRMELNVLNETARQTISCLFAENPPQRHLIPFSYCEPQVIRADLEAAGFRDPAIDVTAEHTRAVSPHDAANGYFRGTNASSEIEARGPGQLERAIEHMASTLAAQFGDGPLAIPNQALLVTAFRPST